MSEAVKSLRKAWNQVISFENLLRAYEHARNGKRSRYGGAAFPTRKKAESAGPSPFRDRVVQHALCRIIQPFFENFSSTEPAPAFWDAAPIILLDLLGRRLPEPEMRRLIALLLATGQAASDPSCLHMPGDTLLTPLERPHGLPIGNLTSQLWANIYLDGLDHFITETLRHGAYLRYMDDFVVLAHEKKPLHDVLEQVKHWLASHRRLRLHENKCHIRNVKEGLTFLGYRVWPDHRRVRRDNVVRARRRVRSLNRRYALKRIDIRRVRACLMAWMGHTRHANARGLEKHIVSKVSLQYEAQ